MNVEVGQVWRSHSMSEQVVEVFRVDPKDKVLVGRADGVRWFILPSRLQDHYTLVEHPNGFKVWDGASAPPAAIAGRPFAVRFRDGSTITCVPNHSFVWNHLGVPGDIVGYKVVAQATPEQFLERDLGEVPGFKVADGDSSNLFSQIAELDALASVTTRRIDQHLDHAEELDAQIRAFDQKPRNESLDIAAVSVALDEALMNENHPYHRLASVLVRAFLQAAQGKGKERHATGTTPFHEQPMSTICREQGSVDGMLYQARKKSLESKRLPDGRNSAEVLGAINYLAGVVIAYESWAKKDGAQ